MSAALPLKQPAESQTASASPYVGDARIEYFEPPSRFQLLDKLHHLIRFSDFLILIQGAGGSGKTSLLRQLRLQAEGGLLCRLALQDKTSDSALLRLLCDGCDLENDGSASDAQRLEQFNQEARLAEDAGLQWLVLVDNADQLTDDALRLLVNLQRAGIVSIRTVIAGSGIGQRLNALGLAEALEGRLHDEHLMPFSEDEAAEFIRLRYPALEVLDSRKLQQMVRSSDRLPGTLERLASGALRLKAPVLPVRRDVSGLILSGVTLMLFVIVGLAGWIYWTPDQSSVPSERVSVPLSVPVVAASIDAIPATIDVVEVDPGLQNLSRLAPAVALVAPVLAVVDGNEVVAPVLPAVEPSEVVAPVSPVVERNEVVAPVSPVVERNEVVAPVSPVVERNEVVAPVLPVVERNEVVAPVLPVVERNEVVAPVLPVMERNEVVAPVSPVVERNEVVAPVLPVMERNEVVAPVLPVVKPDEGMAPVAVETPDVALPMLNVEADPASKSATVQGNVAPNAVIAAAKVTLSNEEVLLNWPDRGYTLQLLGARQLATAKEFIAEQDNPDRFDHFSTLYKGKPWHVVIFGRYNSRKDASNAVREMPQSLQKLQPWARSIQSVKSDIRRIYP